jgi:hypothetical protein
VKGAPALTPPVIRRVSRPSHDKAVGAGVTENQNLNKCQWNQKLERLTNYLSIWYNENKCTFLRYFYRDDSEK